MELDLDRIEARELNALEKHGPRICLTEPKEALALIDRLRKAEKALDAAKTMRDMIDRYVGPMFRPDYGTDNFDSSYKLWEKVKFSEP